MWWYWGLRPTLLNLLEGFDVKKLSGGGLASCLWLAQLARAMV